MRAESEVPVDLNEAAQAVSPFIPGTLPLASAQPGYFWFLESEVGSSPEEFAAMRSGNLSPDREDELLEAIMAAQTRLDQIEVHSDRPFHNFKWVRPS